MAEYLTSLDIKDYKILQDTDDYAFSQDSVFLANIATLSSKDKVLDLGTGSGILSFLAIIKKGVKDVTGIELQEKVADMARRSAKLNNLDNNFNVITGDVKNIKDLIEKESFDKVLCNPPYFFGDTSSSKGVSRSESTATLNDFTYAAAYALKFGGDAYFVMKGDRLSSLLTSLSNNKLEPKELTLVYPKVSSDVDIVIVKARKNAKEGLTIKKLIVKHENGDYTEQYKELYK